MVAETAIDYLPILERLIAFPTVSAASNLDCIDYVEDLLKKHGFSTERFYNQDKTKANLLARLGPETAGGLMLAGHSDVVPVAGQAWRSDPFTLVCENDRLYGRGSADMKGFLALALALAAEVDGAALARPLYLAFTYDEEIGCLGARALLHELRGLRAKPAFVLIGEPTEMALVTAHKGIQLMKTRVTGRAAHSSCPQLGASAIVFAAKLIARLDELLPEAADAAFNPPGASFNVGLIEGGAAVNIIPQHCEFQWEVRLLPGRDQGAVDRRFEQLLKTLAGETGAIAVDHQVLAAVPGLASGENHAAAAFLAGFLSGHRITTAPFVTEGGLYQQAGIPAVICGPGRVEEAHQPNESVSRTAMEQYRDFLGNIVQTLQGAL